MARRASVKKKSRKLTGPEGTYILQNICKMSPKDLAARLTVDESVILDFVKAAAKPGSGYELNDELIVKLSSLAPPEPEPAPPATAKPRPKKESAPAILSGYVKNANDVQVDTDDARWKVLAQEFEPDELEFFHSEYGKMIAQFEGDVLATEEAQIFDAIKLELLKSRTMVSKREARAAINRLTRELEAVYGKNDGSLINANETDQQYAATIETQIQIERNNEVSKTKEWTDLQQRVEKIRQALRSNREQRIKDVQSRGDSFLATIKYLQSRDAQEKEGRQFSLLRTAGENERDELMEPYQFEDGSVDFPILSADTMEREESDD